MRELANLLGANDNPVDKFVAIWGKSPVWQPDLKGLVDGGFIEGWVEGDPESVGRVTEKFHDALYERFGARAEMFANDKRADDAKKGADA